MKKIIDSSLVPKEIDLNKIKKLSIVCVACGETASIQFSNSFKIKDEIVEWAEKQLKAWQADHCIPALMRRSKE